MKSTTPSAHVPSFSLFAQLLANESIRVTINPAASTAMFAPKERLLTLPSWSGFGEEAWLLFIAHEVGHALFTPADAFEHPAFVSLVNLYGRESTTRVTNVFEDVRIERRIREQYRGLAGVFGRGYNSLLQRQFFGFSTDTVSSVWGTKGTLDRLNIYAKVGSLLRVQLTEAQERDWYARAVKAHSFEDVLALVAEVMLTLKEQSQNKSQQGQGQSQQGQSQQEQGQGQSQQEQGQGQSQQEQGQGQSQQGQSQQEQGQGQSGASTTTGTNANPFDVASQTAAESALKSARWESSEQRHILPRNTAFLHYNDVTLEQLLGAWQAAPEHQALFRSEVQQQRREQSAILASMIAAFRANQSAWRARRVQVSKSGSLDTVKLSQYKLTDDLFLRRQSLPEAQNHGFALHMDWSGSMRNKMSTVLWQVLHLIWFAESIHVPVTVYGFNDGGKETPSGNEYCKRVMDAHGVASRARLVEIYRSSASAELKQQAQAFMFMLVCRFGGLSEVDAYAPTAPQSLLPLIERLRGTVQSWGYDAKLKSMQNDYVVLGGTPLHIALQSSVDTVRAFRQAHRIEQCVSVWLTDGEDTHGIIAAEDPATMTREENYHRADRHGLHLGKVTASLFDPRSGRVFRVHEGRSLATLFEMHRTLTGATVVCIDITEYPMSSLKRILSRTELTSIAGRVSADSTTMLPGSGRGAWRGVIRAKVVKQTRKNLIIAAQSGTFEETGLLMATRAQYPEMGCDAYLVTHPGWWAQQNTQAQRAHISSASSILSQTMDDDVDDDVDTRDAEPAERPTRLAAALLEGSAHVAMRRFADLLVPHMAAGRADASI